MAASANGGIRDTWVEAGCSRWAAAPARRLWHSLATVRTHTSSPSIARRCRSQARVRAESAGAGNVEFLHADLFALPFATESFDHAFVCFVLEHLPNPVEALIVIRHLLRPGGTITVFGGDHGSAYFHPDSVSARRAIDCQVELQRRAGGNACVGRQVYPLLTEAGYGDTRVSPRTVYVDGTRPDLADTFTRKTFTSMVQGVRTMALEARLIDAEGFDAGIRDLHRAAEADGVFCYTFFKGTARKRRA
jgi:SAM-dependent methyltransferase